MEENERKCLECGEGFRPSRPSQKFCSVLCYRKNVRKQMEQLEKEVLKQ